MLLPHTHISTDAGVLDRTLPRAIVCDDRESFSAVYGPTSTLMLLNDIKPASPQIEGSEASIERPRKRARREHLESESFDPLHLADKIYEHAGIQNTGNNWWRENIANQHLDYFFNTVHNTHPIMDEAAFRDIWRGFWDNPSLTKETTETMQTRCLINSVLALGALYMNTPQDAKWAASYNSEARRLIGTLFDGSKLSTVQTFMLMVCIMAPDSRHAQQAHRDIGCLRPPYFTAQLYVIFPSVKMIDMY